MIIENDPSAPCNSCVFYNDGDGGYGSSCNLGNDEIFDIRDSRKHALCPDHYDVDEMTAILKHYREE